MEDLEEKLCRARALSRERFGDRITFFLPGMFRMEGVRGNYPALSITGTRCELDCDHCGGSLLRSMIRADTPEMLTRKCERLAAAGTFGVLISGGCDPAGRLPWKDFLPAVERIKRDTGLYVSVHCGIVDDDTARALKAAGVDQALIDVIGDDETYRSIYHVDFGVSRIGRSLAALERAALPVVPHVVCGLYYGRIRAEKGAVEMIAEHDATQVVIVSYMKIPGTRTELFHHPDEERVADIIAEARLRMPHVPISLGCARQRGNTRLETLAVDAGVNRMALPSEEAVARAEEYGLTIRYQRTCCSVAEDVSSPVW